MKQKLIIIVMFFLIIFNLYGIESFAANKVIVLDPGHGGEDPGAINSNKGINERDINLKIANYLKKYLMEYADVTVELTHNGFSTGGFSLIDRAIKARNLKADLLVSLHCNSSESGKLSGAEAFVTANKSLPKYNEQCSKLADMILKKINEIGIENKGVKTRLSGDTSEVYSDGTRGDYFGIIRYAMKGVKEGIGANIQNGEGLSTVLIEHCYINGSDVQYLDSEEDIKKLAKADSDAIAKFYGLRLKSEIVSGVKINKDNIDLKISEKNKLIAKITPETAKNKNVTWKSSNEKVAIVDKYGEVTALSEGEATITVKTEEGGFEDTCKVKVLGIEVIRKELYLLIDEKNMLDYNAMNLEVEYKIDNEEIAKVDEDGIVTGLKEGQTKVIISAKSDKTIKKEIIINVNALKENQKIELNEIKSNNENLSNIKEKTTKEELLKQIEVSSDFEIKINNKGKDYITTNTIIDIVEKETQKIIKRYFCLIYADINEDGKISSMDYTLIKNHIMEVKAINSRSLREVADINEDGKISSMDYTLIKNHIMDIKEIEIR